MSNSKIVAQIKSSLEDRGVTVSVHRAATGSRYLRFDYGVLNQARVGDHRGKGYAYMFEIGEHQPEYKEVISMKTGQETKRYIYPASMVEELVTQVLINRANLKSKYSPALYEGFVKKAKAA